MRLLFPSQASGTHGFQCFIQVSSTMYTHTLNSKYVNMCIYKAVRLGDTRETPVRLTDIRQLRAERTSLGDTRETPVRRPRDTRETPVRLTWATYILWEIRQLRAERS